MTIQELEKLGACKSDIDFVAGFNTYEEAVRACKDESWFWRLFHLIENDITKTRKIRKPYTKFKRIYNSARKDYFKCKNLAFEKFKRIESPAWEKYKASFPLICKEYKEIQEPAYLEYQKVYISAYSRFEKTCLKSANEIAVLL